MVVSFNLVRFKVRGYTVTVARYARFAGGLRELYIKYWLMQEIMHFGKSPVFEWNLIFYTLYITRNVL